MTPAAALATREDLDVEVARRNRSRRAVRGALVALLLVAVTVRSLRSWGVTGTVDAAAAWAGSVSWRAWFLGTLDPAAATSLGSPAAHWVTSLTVQLGGAPGAATVVPAVVMTVAAAAVLAASLRRTAGTGAAVAAGAGLLLLLPAATAQVQLGLLTVLAGALLLRRRRRVGAALLAGLPVGGLAGLAWLTSALGGTLLVIVLVVVCVPTRRRWEALSLVASAAFVVGVWWFVAVRLAGPVVVSGGGVAGVLVPLAVAAAVVAARAGRWRGGRAVVVAVLLVGLLGGSLVAGRSVPAGRVRVDASVAALLAGAGTTWSAAAVGVPATAALELASGTSVLALGGADGLTLAGFQSYVATGRVRYLVVSGTVTGSVADVVAWVARDRTATGVGGTVVYDLATGD